MSASSPFWNRTEELNRIRRAVSTGGFGFVTGRRRVGKTALLEKVCREAGGIYHQAVEGAPEQQILHLTEEIRERLPLFNEVSPKSWGELFRLLSRETLPRMIVFDEFPYWVQGDASLPSVLQKWVDHDLPRQKTLLLVSGSSQGMLHSQFLRNEAPLFGRALIHLNLPPLNYEWFARAIDEDPAHPLTFTRYSLVGGVPHYWRLMPKADLLEQADELYFRPSAPLSMEPTAWLRDEGVSGTLPKALLDLIGRGVSKPSEMAARLNMPQGHLSRPLSVLLNLGFVRREIPFNETPRSTKKVLYSIEDPALRFYYGTYLMVRHQWDQMTTKQKRETIDRHASRQWEIFCRARIPGAARYWESRVEIDLVAKDQEKDNYCVAECKWTDVTASQRAALEDDLKKRFLLSKLGATGGTASFRVFSKSDLKWMVRHKTLEFPRNPATY